MAFDYDRDTRGHYQSEETAHKYRRLTASPSIFGYRHRLIAGRECTVVARMLRRIPHQSVLDVPCGTGKLAKVLSELECKVVSGDVSEQMLTLAKEEYSKLRYSNVTFTNCDLEALSESDLGRFDVAVCIRLLHRVPGKVRENMLVKLRDISNFAIISFGIENTYHTMRRRLRSMTLGGGTEKLCFTSLSETEELLSGRFEILQSAWVLPFLSQERIYLLKAIP